MNSENIPYWSIPTVCIDSDSFKQSCLRSNLSRALHIAVETATIGSLQPNIGTLLISFFLESTKKLQKCGISPFVSLLGSTKTMTSYLRQLKFLAYISEDHTLNIYIFHYFSRLSSHLSDFG